MRATTTTRRGPVHRAKRQPLERLDSHRKWTDRRGWSGVLGRLADWLWNYWRSRVVGVRGCESRRSQLRGVAASRILSPRPTMLRSLAGFAQKERQTPPSDPTWNEPGEVQVVRSGNRDDCCDLRMPTVR